MPKSSFFVKDKTYYVIIPSGMTKILQRSTSASTSRWKIHYACCETRANSVTKCSSQVEACARWCYSMSPSRSLESVHKLNSTVIRKGFVKCFIANAMDSSQDEALWNDDDADVPDGDESDSDIDDDNLHGQRHRWHQRGASPHVQRIALRFRAGSNRGNNVRLSRLKNVLGPTMNEFSK